MTRYKEASESVALAVQESKTPMVMEDMERYFERYAEMMLH